jgi:hypothetical protein
MAKRSKKDEIDPQRSIREQFYPKGRNRGLLIRVQVDFFKTGEVARYALTLVDINGGPDNGRILGYDNAHDYHHRHCLGKVESVEFNTYEEIEARFEKETQRYLKEGEI